MNALVPVAQNISGKRLFVQQDFVLNCEDDSTFCRTCCFNYLRKRTDPNTMKMISNKRLIDFIMLQGRAMFTENELSHERRQQRQRQEQQERNIIARSLPYSGERHNGTLVFEDLQAYYD